MSLGHAGFYGIGAYTTALLATKLHWPFFLTLPAAGVVTALFGILPGLADHAPDRNLFRGGHAGLGRNHSRHAA